MAASLLRVIESLGGREASVLRFLAEDGCLLLGSVELTWEMRLMEVQTRLRLVRETWDEQIRAEIEATLEDFFWSRPLHRCVPPV